MLKGFEERQSLRFDNEALYTALRYWFNGDVRPVTFKAWLYGLP